MSRTTDIAWAAGLFEGEGRLMVRGKQRQPILALAMTDEDVVRRFAAIVECGTVNSYRAYQPNRKRQWQWSVGGKDDVLTVLGLFWEFLGERRQERACELIERAVKINDGAGYCERGHDLSSDEHLYLHKKTGKRHCRTCRDRRSLERRGVPRPAN